MHQRYEALAGVTCRVVEMGDNGRPLLFVHGLGGNADNWSVIMERMATTRRCVALDLPGFGMSAPAKDHDLDTHVSVVVALIDRIGESVTLVGNSMGGLIAERVAGEHPDRVERLVLLAPATPLPRLGDMADATITARLAAQAVPGVGEVMLRLMQRQLTPRQQANKTLELVAFRPELLPSGVRERAVAIAGLRRGMPWAVRAFSESARSVGFHLVDRAGFVAMVRAIRQPTALIWGAEDRIVSPTSLGWLASQRPDWHSTQLEEVGHVPMIEAPDEVIDIVAAARAS